MNKNLTMSPRDVCMGRIKTARMDLLLMLALTVLNVVLYFSQSDTMMLFSAAVPYYAVIFADLLRIPTITVVLYAVAAVSVLAYLLCWLLSKKHTGWLVAATVLFSLDFLVLIGLHVYAGDTSGFIDMVIHALVLYYLILGAVSVVQLKKLPEEVIMQEEPEERTDSTALRRVGEEEKVRILLEEQYGNYHIEYRRVKRVNQLVINNYIYAEVEYLVEPPHTLSAIMDGHLIEVGFDGNRSYLQVDGEVIKRKMRLF